MKGVMSLIKYAARCEYMLVPTEEEKSKDYRPTKSPLGILGYGRRGWCRAEFFIFSLLAEMQQDARAAVKLVSVLRDGSLVRHNEVKVLGNPEEKQLPSDGDLSNPNDTELVKQLEDKMVDAHGYAMITSKFRMAMKEKHERKTKVNTLIVNLDNKLLRPQHVDALMKEAMEYVEKSERPGLLQLELWLAGNQLGPEGGKILSKHLARVGRQLAWA